MVKPRLSPLPVPWMVSPSGTSLRVSLTEEEEKADEPVEVTFVANFGPIRPDAPDAHVRLVFRGVSCARWRTAWSENEVLRERDYDWSLLPISRDETTGPMDYVARSKAYWEVHGVNPDPGFYEVTNSQWPAELRTANPQLARRHFIVLGRDAFVEVLADDWEWSDSPL